jgi:hypothetical protein
MRRVYKIVAASVLAAIPVVWVSAQQFPAAPMPRQDPRFNSGNRELDRQSFGQANPTSGAGDTFTAQPLPKEFALLDRQSIFSKDHRAVSDTKKPVFTGTQSTLVLRGAMKEGDQVYKANIEDTSSSKAPTWVEIGQILTANGARINEITLDHIIVTKPGGATRRIRIGEKLEEGEIVSGPAQAAARASTPTTRPAPTAAASTAGTAGEDAILEMMRERRQKEIGQ